MTNLLIHETSPYLLQHAQNPVWWHAWNAAAWEKAKRENKLVIVSVGYSACHWCHVMEHESFEDTTVAEIMNAYFVCIKVDREERPDVDQIYMDACHILTEQGGWPLNAITLPDGRPIYAGTYFPKTKWIQVLQFFENYWKTKPDEAMERATQITAGIRAMDLTEASEQKSLLLNHTLAFQRINAQWDYTYGGRLGAPKFPMPVLCDYLLSHYFYSKNEKALTAVEITLQKMYEGGIYDHVGGGFARYSVDEYWEIPHFEKMLYDNAQLLSLYAKAFQLTGNKLYRNVLEETFAWLEREMSDSTGAFYSAIDADSEGHEGKFYVWSVAELKEILKDDYNNFAAVYKISESGNFEGYNHLTLLPNKTAEHTVELKKKLLHARNQRIKPLLDDKSLTSWNALAILGCIDAYKATQENCFLARAEKCARLLNEKLLSNDASLNRNYKNGQVTIQGFLDDYAFTCKAFIALYEVSLEETWLQKADSILKYVIQNFYNIETGLFYFTSVNDEELIARKTETNDNVIPSSNAIICEALLKAGYLLYNEDYLNTAHRAIEAMLPKAEQYTSHYAHWAALSYWRSDEPFQIAVVGTHAPNIVHELQQYYLPNCIVFGTETESSMPSLADKTVKDETLIYICKNKTCAAPVKSAEEVLLIVRP
jgi:uncharacterized protein YyaL (SSP411 family)